MIIAIDGPAGSGKSSTARAVAARLGFHHLDSGAYYRAVTYAALRAGIHPDAWPRLSAVDLDGFRIHAAAADGIDLRMSADGEDITDAIRSSDVNAHVSAMATVPAVRGWVNGRLREIAAISDVVTEGRDIGTVVFPHAELKVFLTAAPETRARRRLAQRGATDPDPGTVAEEVDRLTERDRRDSERAIAPLRRADDAVTVDTTDLDFDAQVDRIVALARTRGAGTR